MAFLKPPKLQNFTRRAVLFWGLTIVAMASYCQASDSQMIRAAARKSVQNCNWGKAAFWAQILGKEHRDAGILYRLAWLQTPDMDAYLGEKPDLNKSLVWALPSRWGKAESGSGTSREIWPEIWPEIWKDELYTEVSKDQCKKNSRAKPQTFDTLPQQVLSSLLLPLYQDIQHVGPVLQELLRKYALSVWLQETDIDFGSDPAYFKGNSPEICEWRALHFLHTEEDSSTLTPPQLAQHLDLRKSQLEELFAQCRFPNPKTPSVFSNLLTTVLLVEAGEVYWKTGDLKKAHGYFVETLNLLPEHILMKTLGYRIAVSDLATSRSLSDSTMRLVASLLGDANSDSKDNNEEKDPNQLDDLFKGTLQNLFCERLADMAPQENFRLMRKVFKPDVLTERALTLTQGCVHSDLRSFWSILFKESKKLRAKIEISALLLRGAYQAGSSQDAKKWLGHLIAYSKDSAFFVSHQFWSAISDETPSLRALRLELAKRFLTQAEVSSSDEQKLKRIETAQRGTQNTSVQEKILATDVHESRSQISLSLGASIPGVTFSNEIGVDLRDYLYRELDRLEKPGNLTRPGEMHRRKEASQK